MDNIEDYISYLWKFFDTMLEHFEFKFIFSSLLVYCSDLFGTDWWIIQALFGFLFVDVFLGFIWGIKKRHISERKLSSGVLKFFAYSITIVMAWFIQRMIQHSINITLPILSLYGTYQCITEMVSITKHLYELGIPIPTLFVKLLIQSKNKFDDKIDKAQETIDNCTQILDTVNNRNRQSSDEADEPDDEPIIPRKQNISSNKSDPADKLETIEDCKEMLDDIVKKENKRGRPKKVK